MTEQFPGYIRRGVGLASAVLATAALAGCGATQKNGIRTITTTAAKSSTTESTTSSTTTAAKTGLPDCDTWRQTAPILSGEYLDEVAKVMAEVNPATIGTKGAFEKDIRACASNNDVFTTTDPNNLNIRKGEELDLPLENAAQVNKFNVGIAAIVKKAASKPKKSSAATGKTSSATTSSKACAAISALTYGVDPNKDAATGGGSQLVTVVDRSASVSKGLLTAWQKNAKDCWQPVQFAGQPAQPYSAETGENGMKPFAERVSGDHTTPTGTFGFGDTVYGVSSVSPTKNYPYHHLVRGDWWDEKPGNPTFDQFQHVGANTTPAYAAYSEKLWQQTTAYQHFIDIKLPKQSSDHVAGIFLHDDTNSGVTEGCVAVPPTELNAILNWLNPADDPHIQIVAK